MLCDSKRNHSVGLGIFIDLFLTIGVVFNITALVKDWGKISLAVLLSYNLNLVTLL